MVDRAPRGSTREAFKTAWRRAGHVKRLEALEHLRADWREHEARADGSKWFGQVALEIVERVEREVFESYFIALRGVEKEAFIDAILSARTEQQHHDALRPWCSRCFEEEALAASPMLEALAVIKNVSSRRPV